MKGSKEVRYSDQRIQSTVFEEKVLFWSDDFEEVTSASESGYRLATLPELKSQMYPPLRPDEAFRVQEGLFAPICTSQQGCFASWSYVKIA